MNSLEQKFDFLMFIHDENEEKPLMIHLGYNGRLYRSGNLDDEDPLIDELMIVFSSEL